MITKASFLWAQSKHLLNTLLNTIATIVAPATCAACRETIQFKQILCANCTERISKIFTKQLAITDRYEITVFALSKYQDPIKKMVLTKHYSDQLTARQLASLLWEMTDLKFAEFDYIIPIPLHWSRYAKRGFNQAEEMAIEIAQKSNKPVHSPLTRNKKTVFQALLTPEKRWENVKEAFTLTHSKTNIFQDKTLLVIDDVLTSGATMKAAVKQLRLLKPKAIIAAVACRA